MFFLLFRDRFRTTNNMLGDCYAAAIVEALSKKELLENDYVNVEVLKNIMKLLYINIINVNSINNIILINK